MVAVMVGLYRVLSLEALREKAEERRARRAIDAWIAREQHEKAPEQTSNAASNNPESRKP
jgi:glycine betaine transporter